MNEHEINLKLLDLAQSILSEQLWIERNRAEQNWVKECERIYRLNTMGTTQYKHPEFPTTPVVTHHDIIQVANELSKFVYGDSNA